MAPALARRSIGLVLGLCADGMVVVCIQAWALSMTMLWWRWAYRSQQMARSQRAWFRPVTKRRGQQRLQRWQQRQRREKPKHFKWVLPCLLSQPGW